MGEMEEGRQEEWKDKTYSIQECGICRKLLLELFLFSRFFFPFLPS